MLTMDYGGICDYSFEKPSTSTSNNTWVSDIFAPSHNKAPKTKSELQLSRLGQLIAKMRCYLGLNEHESDCLQFDESRSHECVYAPNSRSWENDVNQDSYASPFPSFKSEMVGANPVLKRLAAKYNKLSRTMRQNGQLSQQLLSRRPWNNFLELSCILIDLLEGQQLRLNCSDGILNEALEQVDDILGRLHARFHQSLDQIKYRRYLAALTYEFPRNMRHLCTTMPWTIWPSLLVLWGVCWMFINSPFSSHEWSNLSPSQFLDPADSSAPYTSQQIPPNSLGKDIA